jgi:hypothetical protein
MRQENPPFHCRTRETQDRYRGVSRTRGNGEDGVVIHLNDIGIYWFIM